MQPVQSKQRSAKPVVISRKGYDAVLFDMDGVVTKTAVIHMEAWKHTFDALMKAELGQNFRPFDEQDYLKYVDGKHREDGVKSFLQSRHIHKPLGSPDDPPGFETIHAIGNSKNTEFLNLLHTRGVEPYETTVALIRSLKEQGFKIAVVTASRNGVEMLKAANLQHIFDATVDGIDAKTFGLQGKPAPDTFVRAADQLGIAVKRAVVVEDAAAGVEAGKNGGFGLVIGVARNNNAELLKKHGADEVVLDLAEVGVEGETLNSTTGTALADLEISDENWVLKFTDFSSALEPRREALCAVGNGYFSTRAAAPECEADGAHYPGTYLAGGYNRVRVAEAFDYEQLVNMPNWLAFTFRIDEGKWFSLTDVEIMQYEQSLDLRQGILRREITFRDAEGRETRLLQRWFVHMRYFHLAALEVNLTAKNWSGKITLRSALDGRVVNRGTASDLPAGVRHLEPVESGVSDGSLYLKMVTTQSRLTVCQSAGHQLYINGQRITPSASDIVQPDYVAQEMSLGMAPNDTASLQKIIAFYTSRDLAISECGIACTEALTDHSDFEKLLEQHTSTWQELWCQFDLFLDTTESQSKMVPSLILHLHIFHTLQTASPNSIDLDTGIPARGWTGEGYEGHIFWDDLFVFPFINLRMPNVTESLLKYRYRRLDQARKLAASLGKRGARFPWQSGSDGREETPKLLWVPEKSIWIEDRSHLQIHVNAAIAYNIWQYYQVSDNVEFMNTCGAEMLFEIARFFATYSTYSESRKQYEIHGVVGPDEFHTAYPGSNRLGINNNAYTNVMAVWTLTKALELLQLMPPDHRRQISARLQITADEIETWEAISRRMYIPMQENGIINEFEHYDKLEEFPWRSEGQLDLEQLRNVLYDTNGTPNQYKLTKQADVLMLFYVFSSKELKELFYRLGYSFSDETIEQNIEYYLPRTANTSTLSRVAHAWVLSRLDRLRSWKLITKIYPNQGAAHSTDSRSSWNIFLEALGSDYFDIQGGSTGQGIHMGAMAGTIDIVQRCYTGIVTRDKVLWLDPQLPSALTRLSFTLHYRDQLLAFEISKETMRITARHSTAKPIEIGFRHKTYSLQAGETRVFQLRSEQRNYFVA